MRRGYRIQESLAHYWADMAVELCHDIDAASLEEHIAPVYAAIERMQADRRIIVIGAAGSGKSTLLAGLAGSPLIARIPWEGPYLRWRFCNTSGDASHSRFVPLESLAGLELIDTPCCADAGHAEALRAQLAGADVIIAAVDARHAEDSPVWDVLASLPEGSSAACMLAVTFSDTLAAEAGLALRDTLRDFCRRKLGRTLPQYFISPAAEQASEVFSERVQEALNGPGGLRTAIAGVVEASLNLVGKQWTVLNRRDGLARRVSGFLAGIEREIDNFLSHQMAGLPRQVQIYGEASARALPRLLKRLRSSLGRVFSPVTLLQLELLGTGCERFYYRTLRHELLRLQEESDCQFLLSCAAHWKSVRPRMTQTLDCEIGDFPTERMTQELAVLRERLGRELYEPFTREQLRRHFNALFVARAGWMRACLAFCSLFLICAGLLGFLEQTVPALGVLALSFLIWVGASIAHAVAARRIAHGVAASGEKLETALAAMLPEAVSRLVLSRVAAYRCLYTEPRNKVAQQEDTLKPLQARQTELYRQLHAPIFHL